MGMTVPSLGLGSRRVRSQYLEIVARRRPGHTYRYARRVVQAVNVLDPKSLIATFGLIGVLVIIFAAVSISSAVSRLLDPDRRDILDAEDLVRRSRDRKPGSRNSVFSTFGEVSGGSCFKVAN